MNPDIQIIAERWAEGYKDPQVSAYEVIKAALEELSSLRDTQERELREDKRRLDWLEQNAGQLAHCTWMNTNMGRLFTFRYGITLGDCEKTLRAAVDVELEQREGVIDPQEIGETKVAESDLEQRFLKLQEDYQSLRAELARRDEVEKELREEIKVLNEEAELFRQNANDWFKKWDSLRSRIGELEKQLKDLEGESFERDILG